MKVHLAGGRTLVLRRNDFLAAGGEGSVYARDGVAYKIFASPAAAPPPDKLAALAAVAGDDVLAPIEPLRNAIGEPIGYAMPFVADTVSLAQLTTRAYRQRVGFGDRDALALLVAMRDAIVRIHAAGLVIVDLSPNNVLVRRGVWTPCFIDTDSWQTPAHDATAVTPTIRDPLAAGPRFDRGVDWFAFAVVTFELLVGIHPFKGRHPRVRGLSARMRAGISALDPAVALPAVCASLDAIPSELRAWYRGVFERGDRSPPPRIASPPIVATEPGTALAHAGGRPIVVGRTPDGRVTLDGVASPIVADEIAGTRGHVFARRGGDVFELVVHAPGGRPIAAPRLVATAMPHASALYPGVLLQSVLGATHATLLEGRACTQVRLPELDRIAIVDARHEGGVLVVIACREGAFDRFVFRFDGERRHHDARVTRGVAPIGAVFATTTRGVAILRVDDGLEVLAADPGHTASEARTQDRPHSADLRLAAAPR